MNGISLLIETYLQIAVCFFFKNYDTQLSRYIQVVIYSTTSICYLGFMTLRNLFPTPAVLAYRVVLDLIPINPLVKHSRFLPLYKHMACGQHRQV